MFENLRELYNDIIRDHDRHPRNFRVLEGATQSARGHNPICGDNIVLYLRSQNGVIKDASFSGESCALCRASASLLTEFVKGKTQTEAEDMFVRVRELMMTGDAKGDLGKQIVFSTVHKHPIRIKCAILPWHALIGAIKGDVQPVNTEDQ